MKKNVAKILVFVLVVAMCAMCFTACVPTDATKAKTKLDEAGYKAVLTESVSDKIAYRITATKGTDDYVTITYYNDAKVAKYDYKEMKLSRKYAYDSKKLDHDRGELSDADWESFKADYKATKISRNGKVIVYGEGAAYKAATK